MSFENLNVNRIAIHRIFKRRPDGNIVQPALATAIATLSPKALDAFHTRVINALGSDSQSMPMAVLPPAADAAIVKAERLALLDTHEEFLEASTWFPNKLALVQTGQRLPGGIIVVFDGTVGNPARNVVGIIKADTSSGFRRLPDSQMDFVEDIFLGEHLKLYKIGMFVRPLPGARGGPFPDGWDAIVYDANILSDRGGAAKYFYETFLGCAIPLDAKDLTNKFYSLTQRFIRNAELDEDAKGGLFQALHTYLKVDRAATIQVAAFSEQYLAPELRDPYADFMSAAAYPTNAIQKDITEIRTQVARRKIRFRRDVQLTGSVEAFDDYVTVESIEGERTPNGTIPSWTRITVKDRILEQH